MNTNKALKKCDSIFNPFIFKICILVMTLLTSVPFIHMYLGKYVKIFLLYGILSLIYLVFRKGIRTVFKDKPGVLLIAFCVCYGVTVLLNRSSNFSENASALVYMSVFFCLFFIFTLPLEETAIRKEYKVLSCIIIIFTFIFALINFFMFAFKIGGSYMTNDQIMYYGMYDNRLWGLYNANTNSMLCDISIVLSLGFILDSGHRIKTKVFCFANAVFEFICLLLTGSRAALYTLYVTVALIIFLWVVKKDDKKEFKKNIKGLVAGVLSAVLLFVSSYAIKYVVSYVPSICGNVMYMVSLGKNSDSSQEDSPNNKWISLEREDLTRLEEVEERPGGILTGRTDLWQAGVKAFSKSPLFGIGRENVYSYAKDYLKSDLWAKNLKVGGLHNIYLTILVSSGISGFVLMAVFALMSLFKMAKLLFKEKKCDIWFIVSLAMIVLFYVTEFVEARILNQVGIFYVIFWIYLGLTYALANRSEKTKEADK